MTFDWNNLSSVAEYLNANCDKLSTQNGECVDREATFRTVVNRAYYAAFNVANDFVKEKFGGLVEGDGGGHSRLIKTFREYKKENIQFANIATKLGRIKNNRVDADYRQQFRQGHPNYTAQLTMRTSQEIISLIDSI